jgi:hypothetical protein
MHLNLLVHYSCKLFSKCEDPICDFRMYQKEKLPFDLASANEITGAATSTRQIVCFAEMVGFEQDISDDN